MLIPATGIQVNEDGIAFHLSRILHSQMIGISEHGHNLLLHFLFGIRQINTVSERFAHLGLTVGTRKAKAGLVVRKKDGRFHKRLSVHRIEFVHDLLGLLNHGRLIFAHRHGCCLESGNIRRLTDGIGEKTDRKTRFKIAQLDFRLHCRITLKSGDCYQVHVVKGHFAKFGHLRLDEQNGFFRVQPASQIIQSHFDDVLAYLFRIVRIVRQGLGISNHDVNFVKFP